MKYFDAHTHANFAAYDEDREVVMVRAREAGVGMNVVGTQRDTAASAIALAENHDGVYATIGLHPVHTDKSYHDTQELGGEGVAFTSRGETFDESAYREMAKHPKVIAIGECGLDYYHCDESSKKRQKDAFEAQIDLANTVGKPLMLHIRASAASGGKDAYDDALEILRSCAKVRADVHFFAGDWDTAKKFLDLGCMLSFTGVLTFTQDYDEVVRSTPLNRLLSETDAPYVSPKPYRGKRNEPAYVVEVVKALARIREVEMDLVGDQLLSNAQELFGIPL